MCGKRPFGSKQAARQSVRAMHETIRVYWCDEHKAYHTTQERYGKIANSGRAFTSRKQKASNRRRKGRSVD